MHRSSHQETNQQLPEAQPQPSRTARLLGRLGLSSREAEPATETNPDLLNAYAMLDGIEHGLEAKYHAAFGRDREGFRTVAHQLVEHDPANARIVEAVMLHNKLEETELPPLYGKTNLGDKIFSGIHFLDMYRKDPTLAETIVENQINGFHGTRSGVLPTMLRYGLLSEHDVRRNDNIKVRSGERTYGHEADQPAISFAGWQSGDDLCDYVQAEQPFSLAGLKKSKAEGEAFIAKTIEDQGSDNYLVYNSQRVVRDLTDQIETVERDPNSLETQLLLDNYPVAIGADLRGFETYDSEYGYEKAAAEGKAPDTAVIKMRTHSQVQSEFTVSGNIPPERLKVIAVPKERIAEVEQMVKSAGLNSKVVDLAILAERNAPTW